MPVDSFPSYVTALERLVGTWPEGLDECVELVRELAGSDVLRERIAGELAALAATPTYTPSRSATANHWVLWTASDGRRANLALVRVPAALRDDADYLTDAPAHQVLAPCGPGGIAVERYEQCAAADPEVMGGEEALAPRGTVTLGRGDVLVLRPRRDVVDLPPGPEARYLLVFEGPRLLTQRWVYDKETRRAVASVAADPRHASLEGGMRLLRVLGHTAAAPVVAALASHEAHFVRWSAIRYAMALDPAEGHRLLRAALADPHPHVRRGAERALARVAAGARGGEGVPPGGEPRPG